MRCELPMKEEKEQKNEVKNVFLQKEIENKEESKAIEISKIETS